VKKKTGVTIIGVFVALLLIAVVLGIALVRKYTPNKEYISPEEVMKVPEGEAYVTFWNEKYEKNALLFNDGIYLDLETVFTYINEDFYYDEKEFVLTYTTPDAIIRAYPMEAAYYSNEEKKELLQEPILTEGGVPYMSLEFAALFSDMTYTVYEKPARVLIRTGGKDVLTLKAQKNTTIRTQPDIKSPNICDLKKDSVVWYVDAGTETSTKFVKVMTDDGLFGFVNKKDLSETYHESYDSDYVAPVYPHNLSDRDVVLGWHQVTNRTANAGLENLIKNNEQLTVVSPTWFRLAEWPEEGEPESPILSLADAEYVETAKSYGLEVWGLIDDFKIPEVEGFDSKANSYRILSSTGKREALIDALVAEAVKYGLDGFNIDFELIAKETGPHFIQFLRELSVKCRANGLVLSVDNYVPSPHNNFYDWAAQGEVVDYVIIMAYDEHYAGSEVAGSVASYNFLTKAVDNILTMVPKEQVIMGVPFYTRLWTETKENGSTELTSTALSMLTAEAELSRNKVTPVWDEETRQNYAEFEKDGALCKMWMEDVASLTEKILYIRKADLAGIAAWRLGYEPQEVWELFEKDVLTQ